MCTLTYTLGLVGHGPQVWSTVKQMSRYAIQHGCRRACLVTGREMVCCCFHTVAAPQVSHLFASGKNVHVDLLVMTHHTTRVPLHVWLHGNVVKERCGLRLPCLCRAVPAN